MGAVIARLNSPVKKDGTRDVIYFETTIDAIIDHTTGKTLRDLIDERTYPEASEVKPGLMSALDKQNLDELYRQLIIISDINPERPCQWFQLKSTKYEVIESGPSIPTVPKHAYFYEWNIATSSWLRVNDLDKHIQDVSEILGRHDFVLKKTIDTINGTTYISEFGSTYVPSIKYTVNNTCTVSFNATDDQVINGHPASTITIVLTNINMSSISTETTYSLAMMLLPDGEDPDTPPAVTSP